MEEELLELYEEENTSPSAEEEGEDEALEESEELDDESALTTYETVDYSTPLEVLHTDLVAINVALTVLIFIALFKWIEDKFSHITRSLSSKWKT